MAMFTSIACGLVVLMVALANRGNQRDRASVSVLTDDEVRTAILQARQDLKLIAFLLAAILLMLGIIADRVAR